MIYEHEAVMLAELLNFEVFLEAIISVGVDQMGME